MVPVLDKNKNPLMPCSEKRARKLLECNRAKPYWYKGFFTIILQDEPSGNTTQDICVGLDPGSKMNGMTVKSEAHTFLNLQVRAKCDIKDKVEKRANARRTRRQRNCPYRKCRTNRKGREIPPSTKARWQQHLNMIKLCSRIYPVNYVSVEDIKAKTKRGARKWNANFSPIEVGKTWFYGELKRNHRLYTFGGYETYEERNILGLKKSKNKLAIRFSAHCVDSWVLANKVIGGHTKPDNERLVYIQPLTHFRRQLHVFAPLKGTIRKQYGGTISMGFRRGTLVRHPKYGHCLVGGTSKGRISVHDLETNKRLTQNIKKEDILILTTLKYNTKTN